MARRDPLSLWPHFLNGVLLEDLIGAEFSWREGREYRLSWLSAGSGRRGCRFGWFSVPGTDWMAWEASYYPGW